MAATRRSEATRFEDMDDARARWDERYRQGDHAGVEQSVPVIGCAARWMRAPGRVLDLACGSGRNALPLARAGFHVTGVDVSGEALARLAESARRERLPVHPVQADLDRFGVRAASIDVVVNTFFLLRSAFQLLRAALRPGGLLLFETYTVQEAEELGGSMRREFLLDRGELRREFTDWELLLYQEGVLADGGRPRGLARMIARKP